jgi:hypothetical protein
MTAAELVNCRIATRLIMLNELRPIALFPPLCSEWPRQRIALKRLELGSWRVAVELARIIATRESDFLLPRIVAWRPPRDLLDHVVGHACLSEWMVVGEHRLKLSSG